MSVKPGKLYRITKKLFYVNIGSTDYTTRKYLYSGDLILVLSIEETKLNVLIKDVACTIPELNPNYRYYFNCFEEIIHDTP